MPVTKIDPKIIFASDAPSQDQPSVFPNKPVGWGVSRQNGGRPTIKQANGVQQDTDLKILWLNENAVLPYDASLDYPVNAVTIKDGVFKIFNGTVWNLFLDKTSVGLGNVDNTSDSSKPISTATQTALNLKANQTDLVNLQNTVNLKANTTYVDTNLALKAELSPVKRGTGNLYDSALTYNINETVVKTNGDVVKSTINGNTNNPNLVETGWVAAHLVPSKNLSDVASPASARTNLDVYSKTQTDANIALAAETPDATETIAGKVKINNTLNSTATDAALTAAQGKVLNDKMLGVGQTWTNLTGSRTLGTTYTNSTGKAIYVSVRVSMTAGATMSAYVSGLQVCTGFAQNSASQAWAGFIAPDGSTYSVSASGLSTWSEMR